MHFTDDKSQVIEKSKNRQSKVIFQLVPQYTFAVPKNKIPLKPMKNFTLLFVLLLPIFGFSQTLEQSLSWGQVINLTLPTTQNQTYNTISLHQQSIVIVPQGVNLTINGQVQGGKIIFLGNNIVKILGDINGNGKMEIGQYSSLEITGNINSNPDLTFLGYNTVSTQNIHGGTLRLQGNTCFRVNGQINNQNWIGSGSNNTVNYNIPASWNFSISSPNISFSNNTNVQCTAFTACTPPTNDDAFGTNEWNGYVYTYTGNNTDFSTANFIGTLKENPNFERNVGAGAVNGRENSLNIPCVEAPSNNFMIRYKMKITPTETGNYNFTVGGDDGYRLYISPNSNTPVINAWSDQGFNTKAIQKYLTAGVTYYLTFEYYEKGGDAMSMFSYGLTKGDRTYPYGINSWNVYAFSTADINLPSTANASSYAGMYVDNNLNINTNAFWGNQASPSAYTTGTTAYQGAPVPNNNFTITYKRDGFPCGRYQIDLDKWDDVIQVYVDGQMKYDNTSPGNNVTVQNNGSTQYFNLDKNSKVEIRLRENGGDAFLKVNFVNNPIPFNTNSNYSSFKGKPIQITSNTILTGKLDVCSCTVAAGKTLTIKKDAILNVDENIVVEAGGKIIVENDGALVQTNDDATYTGNNESFLLKRTTTPVSRFDFTYWSSPLKTSSDFLVGRDQTNPNRKGLSKTTFFDKYYSYSGAAQAWITIPYGTEVMVPAKGYIVRAPQEFAITNTPSATFTANFEGVPNNGVITLPLSISTVGKSNLIGNPYPSAIDAYKFIDENTGLMDGTFYFWTHNIALSSTPDANGILQYNPASYISLNKTGSTSNGKNSPKASRNIAAGQGFFINSTNAGAITFNNSMRVTKKNSNSSFFRMANTTQSSEETNEEIEETAVEANRVWLNISNTAGAYNETLIGYVSGATNNLEDAYDGITYASGTAIYTLQSNKKLVIQGRALPFVDTDVVPLGFMAATAGEYTIAIESFDGLFEDQKVFLVDRTDNSIHNLKNESYTFTSQTGTFDSRFEIRYVNDSTLGTDNPIITQNDVVVFKSANQISVRANNLTIDNVQVYDITGKLITSAKNINDSTFTTSGLNVATQVLIVKVTLDDNQTISKKVIMN